MIKMIDGDLGSLLFDNNDIFFKKIISEYNFSASYNETYLYFQMIDDEITSLILKSSSAITLSIKDSADFNEINEFLTVIGYDSVFCDEKHIDKLSLHNCRVGNIMYCHTENEASVRDDVTTVDNENLKNLYELINNCFELRTDFSSWFVDCSHKLRHNFLKIKAVSLHGKFVACAFSMFEYKNSSIISCVCTDENHRGEGLASSCVNSLKNELMKNSTDNFYVFCEDGKIEAFYKTLGFESIGRWCEYVR